MSDELVERVKVAVQNRKRMCADKKMYETQSKANKGAVKIDGRAYECPYCFTWHVTTKPERL